MATSWFKYNTPGISPNPTINPLSFSQVLTTPAFTTGTSKLAFIFAETQLINNVVRPIIPGSGPYVTIPEINTAISTSTSSTNAYVENP
jgi:hypothetical protein